MLLGFMNITFTVDWPWLNTYLRRLEAVRCDDNAPRYCLKLARAQNTFPAGYIVIYLTKAYKSMAWNNINEHTYKCQHVFDTDDPGSIYY